MKVRTFLSVLIILLGTLVNAQESGIREIKPFYEITAFGNLDIELVKGEKESVEIFPGNYEIDDVITDNDETELKVKLNSKILNKEVNIRVKVTYTEIRKITANGGADVWCKEKLTGNKLWLDAASGGTINLVAEVEDIEAKVNSGSTISLQGKANTIDATANSGGIISAFELECKSGIAKSNVGGKIKITTTEKIEANATSGYIGYKGNPDKVYVKDSLGGTVVAVDEDEEEE